MKKQQGFSLIELLIVVVIIGIVAAIAIPNLLASRRSANEAATISAMRTIHGAQNTYAATQGRGDYAGTVAGLDTAGFAQLGNANLIDPTLATATKSGYQYLVGTTNLTSSNPATFCARAIPTQNSGVTQTGTRCFGVATNGVIMTNTAASIDNCGCSIDNNAEFVDRSSPLVGN